jgi:hypothetical protein
MKCLCSQDLSVRSERNVEVNFATGTKIVAICEQCWYEKHRRIKKNEFKNVENKLSY